MSTDLRRAFDTLAHDIPALGALEPLIARHRLRRRRQLLAATAAALTLVVAATAGFLETRSAAPAPPAHDEQGRIGLALPRFLDVPPPPAPKIVPGRLPGGAAMAVQVAPSTLLVINGELQRRVVVEGRAGGLALSPDGRYLSYSFGLLGVDGVAVVDITTGRRLLHRTVHYGEGETNQLPMLHWAGDARHLVEERAKADGTGRATVRVWELTGGTLRRAGATLRLPGRFAGVDEHAQQFLAEDGDQLAMADARDGVWRRTGIPATPPGRLPDFMRAMNRFTFGVGRWSAANQVGWVVTAVGPDGAAGVPELRTVDLATGTWSTREVPSGLQFLGWHGARALLLRSAADGEVEVVAVPTDGPERVLTRVRAAGWEDISAAVAAEARVGRERGLLG